MKVVVSQWLARKFVYPSVISYQSLNVSVQGQYRFIHVESPWFELKIPEG